MSRRWDEYVQYEDPIAKVMVVVRCYGPGTAAAIAQQKIDMGFHNVKIIGRPASRKKERISVSHSSIQLHQWSRRGY